MGTPRTAAGRILAALAAPVAVAATVAIGQLNGGLVLPIGDGEARAQGQTPVRSHSSVGELRRQFLRRKLRGLGVPRSTLERIASCESGGDPRARSAGGLYRGKYQFSVATWRSVGGRGDPAKAPELEQDVRAAKLYARSGPGQWPTCG